MNHNVRFLKNIRSELPLWVDSRLLSAKFRLVAIYELMRNERQRSNLNLP